MKLVAPEQKHIDEVFSDLRDEDLRVINQMGGVEKAKGIAEQMIKQSVAQAFVAEDGHAVALFVGFVPWEGLMEISAYTANGVNDNKVGFFKATKRLFGSVMEMNELRRMSCHVWGDYTSSIKWLERLGFTVDGHMKSYGPGGVDATIMGRVF